MYIRIEKSASVPISKQIAEQIRAQCLSGILKPNHKLTSVRELARELAVNVNTVFRVYERLVAEGLIEMRHGEGTFILPPSEATEAAGELKKQREQYIREYEAIIRRGLLLGITTQELRRLLSTSASDTKTEISKEKKRESHNE